MFKLMNINHYEVGLRFVNGKLTDILTPGWHIVKTILGERVDVESEKDLFLAHPALDEVIRTGLLNEYLDIVVLKDRERALLWVDGRFKQILAPGKHAIWKRHREVTVERLTVEEPQFKHRELARIAAAPGSETVLRSILVDQNQTCLYFRDGELVSEFGPGFYAFWKDTGTLKFVSLDRREKLLELSGQDIITADKVSLRLNALISYQVADARKVLLTSDAPDQALYREGQLLLRAAVGGRKLDDILNDKEALTNEIAEVLKANAGKFGYNIISFGIKDIILPGDIRELMNRVVAAQKEAEANQIVRREETAATRSQCNTAKMLEQNPTLMRLRELEVLERIVKDSKLKLVIGDKGLTEKLAHLL